MNTKAFSSVLAGLKEAAAHTRGEQVSGLKVHMPAEDGLLRPITVEHDDNGTLLITCPELPEVATFADNEGKVIARANEAIGAALAARG